MERGDHGDRPEVAIKRDLALVAPDYSYGQRLDSAGCPSLMAIRFWHRDN